MPDHMNARSLVDAFVCGLLAGFGLYSLVVPAQHAYEKMVIKTPGAPKHISPYYQAVRHGDIVFLSGQMRFDLEKGNLEATGEEQTIRGMENQKAILHEAGLEFSDVVKTRIYLTNMSDWKTITGIFGQFLDGKYPDRATVMVAGLPRDANVKIEMIAQAM